MSTIDLRMPEEDECFLCRKEFDGDQSDEHVYPKWFLKSHNLWEATVDLPNDTTFKMGQFRVPCCVGCNSGPLSTMESRIKRAFDDGIAAVRALPRDLLFQWSCKIGYGTLLRMTSLDGDRRRPQLGKIIHPYWLANHRALRLLLQTITREAIFADERGYSLFIFETHAHAEPPAFRFFVGCPQTLSADFSRHGLMVVIVHNGVGMICVPLDGGFSESLLGPLFASLHSIPLHRCQYLELLARVEALEGIREGTMTYSLIEHDGQHLIFPVSSPGPVYGEWDHEFYLTMLKYNWDFSRLDMGWKLGTTDITCLRWPDGAPIIMNERGQPTNAAGHWPVNAAAVNVAFDGTVSAT